MQREKRNIYYLRDDAKKLILCNDDKDKTLETCFEEIEEIINTTTGKYLIIELPEKPIGQGTRGGNTIDKKFEFRVALPNDYPSPSSAAMISTGGLNNNHLLTLLLNQMQQNNALTLQMANKQHENEMARVMDKLKEMDNGKGDYIKTFAETFADRFMSGAKMQNAVNKTVEQSKAAAPLADETKPAGNTEQREKIKTALKNFRDVDADFANNMEFLSKYAKANPAVYNMFIENLKKEMNNGE